MYSDLLYSLAYSVSFLLAGCEKIFQLPSTKDSSRRSPGHRGHRSPILFCLHSKFYDRYVQPWVPPAPSRPK